jgi:hypothetical protein
VDRKQMLHHLVTVMTDEDNPLRADLAAAYAGVAPETSRELVDLWMAALRENPSLIPEAVRQLDYEDFVTWFLSSLDTFALGYMLAVREALEAQVEAVRCVS